MKRESLNHSAMRCLLLTVSAVLLLLLAVSGNALAGENCTVDVTYPEGVGIISLKDAAGNEFASQVVMMNAAGHAVLAYDASEHDLSSVSIVIGGYYPATAAVSRSPSSYDGVQVAFTLSSEDPDGGYGDVSYASSEAPSSPLPVWCVVAGLVCGGMLVCRRFRH